ncbi:type 11 methyltransferase [Leptolyngbya sp. Heron Island J]|uniref:class I SAM-dependent methyltransferase n=1 Tax=Leptolyngbya sp. Heron Island J TaxID=1385935 RepID=UPI0003B98E48|nr:class I SAM-dependent methyltransferase [Leptolyngbya sp. Heron Island J]ESA34872.1 type 11 methyltransferase [Leptolyngbya sp. Heron Island J]
MIPKTFAQYEQEGWQRNAATYDVIDLPTTRQAVTPILDSLGSLQGLHILELASGTGYLAKQAVAQGATVTGLDISPKMVKIAQKRVSVGASFLVGDASDLPFEAERFDAVVCSFGFPHFAYPQKVLKESARVLKSDGILTFTVWPESELDNNFFGLIQKVCQIYADPEVDLPPAPSSSALANPTIREPMMTQAGFKDIYTQTLDLRWPLQGPETMVEFIVKGSVRTRMLYERQTPAVQAQIRAGLVTETMAYIRDGKKSIPCPGMLVIGSKAVVRMD